MYKSPIEIVEDIQEKVTLSMENNVVRAVQAVGINIDKHELIAALMQDKSRYEAAYEQGKRDAEKHGRWIPVSERLPDPYQRIIATVRHSGCNEEEYNRVVYMTYGGESNILAWMPLPEPWKGEEG